MKIVPILELSRADALSRDHFVAAMPTDALPEDVVALGAGVVGAEVAAPALGTSEARFSHWLVFCGMHYLPLCSSESLMRCLSRAGPSATPGSEAP
jgi:hypothetical protein